MKYFFKHKKSLLKSAQKMIYFVKFYGGLFCLVKKSTILWRQYGLQCALARFKAVFTTFSFLHLKTPYVIQDRLSTQLKNIEQKLCKSNSESIYQHQHDTPKISILMPVYKVPLNLLSQAIDSVLWQIYPNWELCIVDDYSQSEEIKTLLQDYTASDTRIKVHYQTKNTGISSATNAAYQLATGNYIALLDNDDLLTNDALEQVAKAIIQSPQAQIFYSNECKIDKDGKPVELFSKPDWSPTLLFNCMYIGHLTIYSKALLKEVGKFRSTYDFSQDYDLALRTTEYVSDENIIHIDETLYAWRMLEDSAASGGKAFARKTNIAALQDAIVRRKYDANALPLPSANRVFFNPTQFNQRVSIIIPSDNEHHIRQSIDSILENTTYECFEIIVVTNSKLIELLKNNYPSIQFAHYNLSYNFSDKCNHGFKVSTGEYIIFYNDDVRPIAKNWITCILEYLSLDGVGIVGGKLLYENGTIQHAGMVTGVRRLVGTAFHCYPQNTSAYYNFAQSVREVSIISGACLGIKRNAFEKIGGFDAKNFSINHSDVDLCFKIRELGLRCVYTPYALMTHIGHLSLAEHETQGLKKAKDKSDILLIKRWSNYLARDPYFTKDMREQLYLESLEPYQVFAPEKLMYSNIGKKDILIVTHDLSESGAPRVVLETAKCLLKEDYFVVVMSPSDGPLRTELQAQGVTVIVDSLLLQEHSSVFDFAKNFDLLIANTVVTWPVVWQISRCVSACFYIHESHDLIEHIMKQDARFIQSLASSKSLWCGSKLVLDSIKNTNSSIHVLEYGIDSIKKTLPISSTKIKKIGLFASYEPRKGQDLLLKALAYLSKDQLDAFSFHLFGRVLDQSFFHALNDIIKPYKNVFLNQDIDYDVYIDELLSCDLIIIPSHQDTLPLVSLHALCASKPLMCSKTTGTSQYIVENVSGFIIDKNTPISIANSLVIALKMQDSWAKIGQEAQTVFERHFAKHVFHKKLTQLVEYF